MSAVSLKRMLEDLQKARRLCGRDGSWAYAKLIEKQMEEIKKKISEQYDKQG